LIYQRNKEYFQPLGKLKDQRLKDARKVLEEIQVILEEEKPDGKKLRDLTNKFYTVIPTQDQSKLPTIDSLVLLREKFLLLKTLEETEQK